MGRARELAELATAYDAVNSLGFRNRIINGDMRIFQRGAAATADSQYSIDRWMFVKSNDATESASQNSDAPTGFVSSLRNTVSVGDPSIGSSQYSGFEQNIEGFNVADLGFGTANARSVTLSFWVRSSVTGQYTGSIRNSDATKICPFNYTVNSANTWEQKTVTVAGDTTGTWNTTNGRGITVALYAALGSALTGGTAGVWGAAPNYGSGTPVNGIATSGNIFAITGVQLEAGSVATPFERRPYGTELALCQRYYELCLTQWVGSGAASSSFGGTQVFAVQKRTAPTIVQVANNVNYTQAGVTASTSQYLPDSSATLVYRASNATFSQFSERFSASAEL